MTIGDVIKKYRNENGLSQRQFALKCNTSNGYISMLEKGRNPKTDEPIMPSLVALKAIASAMNISLNELLLQVDDMPVDLYNDFNVPEKTEMSAIETNSGRTAEFIKLFQMLTEDQQVLIISQIKGILSNQ